MRQLRPRCLTNGTCELRLQSCVWGAAWLRGAEAKAAAAYNITLYELMKRAGGVVFDVCRRSYPTARHWLVLCGAGNNGGDGYVVARLAAANAGLRVTVVTAASKSKHALPAEASAAFTALKEYMEQQQQQREKEEKEKEKEEILQKACGRVTIQDAHAWQAETIADDIDLIVDGLLGTGISGAPRAEFAALIDCINALSVPRVAIDIPSGLNAETGAVEGACVRADHTVTFIALKPGLFTGRARDYVGKLHYNTLELNDWMLAAERQKEICCRRLFHAHLQTLLLPHARSPCSHKGANGKVLLIGGDHGFGGAIIMAAEAALRTGAGLVRVLTRAEHTMPLLCRCPEVMVSELNEISLQEGLQWASCIAVGPGIGQGEWGKKIIEEVQRYSEAVTMEEKPSVWDADALNILASHKQQRNTKEEGEKGKEEGVKYIKPLKTRILTPHPGEAARLLNCSIADVERDRFHAAKAIATRYGGVVLLKGPGTVLYAAEDAETQVGLSTSNELLLPRCVIADVGNSGMATGGMGDVLTGIIAGLLGQRMSVWSAACTGCLVHGTAADLAVAAQGGERGLTATMLFDHIHSCVNPHGM
ncbi:YjeF N-terminal domain [Trypanosoma melophagium]|uniref:YjeF N-terminal domain n=1 Tax=Trypanosoma melophagium TaxID=715481 RepID=UPI003519E3FD|nr:YjeF N-terminal domain [Trypanosoma melophagium]